MDTPNDLQGRLAVLHARAEQESQARALSRAAQAEENRRRFPTAAMAMDLFACFNPRILYAREGTDEIGTRPPWRRDHAK